MSDAETPSDLERIAEALSARGIGFVVIGGQAEALHGSPRVTFDIDLCYDARRVDRAALAAVLTELGAGLRVPGGRVEVEFDAALLSQIESLTLSTREFDLDLLAEVPPLGDYARIRPRTVPMQVGASVLPVLSLEDLIRVKSHLRRPKDLDALRYLLAIRGGLADGGPPIDPGS